MARLAAGTHPAAVARELGVGARDVREALLRAVNEASARDRHEEAEARAAAVFEA